MNSSVKGTGWLAESEVTKFVEPSGSKGKSRVEF